jgi:hypothetical protein
MMWVSTARSNAEEIAQSMLELGGMAGGAAEVRSGLADADAGLQAVGARYGQRLVELQELRATQANMAATRQVPELSWRTSLRVGGLRCFLYKVGLWKPESQALCCIKLAGHQHP